MNLSRALLLRLVVSLLLVSAAVLPASAAAHKARHYLIGLQLYTVRDQCAKDFQGTLKAVADMGFDGVEFAGYYGQTAQTLRKWLDDDHLACYGSHISIGDLQGDNFDKTVAFAKTLGCHLLVVPSLPGDAYKTKAGMIAMAHQFSDFAKKLRPEGIMLAYHNHEIEFQPVEGELPWDTFFSNADPDVLIQFDIGNALEGGVQALPFLTKYPGRVISVHVKDYSKTDNDHTLLGQGDENWKDVIPVLKGRHGPRWLVIEQETYPYPSLDCAQKCLASLKQMLAAK